jgi:PilZ domain
MGMQRRKDQRIHFEQGYPARIMGIDGTWYRDCIIEDISQTGAQVSFTSSVDGLPLKELFLVLASRGTVHRRCEMVWLNGSLMGLRFIFKPVGEVSERRRRPRTMNDGALA